MSSRRAPSIIESFNFAFEGIIHVLRTQRNMRIHFAVAAVVLVAALAVGVDRLELIVLMLAIAFVGPDEMRALKREHLGLDEETDVLSFPLDGRDEVPEGVPRALGDVVLCPAVVGDAWRAPLVHGLLHLLGYDHGDEMQAREQEHVAR